MPASIFDSHSLSFKLSGLRVSASLFLCAVLLTTKISLAASATWSANPSSGNWNDSNNWAPMTVPNGPNDVATFATSDNTTVSLAGISEVSEIIFNSGASNFFFNGALIISGTGITNNSGLTQRFVSGTIKFTNSATPGNFTEFNSALFTNFASAGSATCTTAIFDNSSSAGSATVGSGSFYSSSTAANAMLGSASFYNFSTAANATWSNGASFHDFSTIGNRVTINGGASFFDSTTTGNVTTINGGASFHDSTTVGKVMTINGGAAFYDNAAAMTATLIANAGSISFNGNSTADMARVKVFGSAYLDIRAHASPDVAVGSIEGSGSVPLGDKTLIVGTNTASTTFSGHIQDSPAFSGGSLVKAGTGTFVLTNSNTYTGGTRIDSGTLQASHDRALGDDLQNGSYVSIGPDGTLTLDNGATNDYIANRASLSIVTGATVNLNFTGNADRIRNLTVDGISQPPGIYGGPASGAPNQLPQLTGTGTILATIKAVSRKTHGASGSFDIDLPLTGPPGIECRSGGANRAYQVVLTFFNTVTFTSAAVISGSGTVASSSGSGTNTVIVNLTGVNTAQIIKVGIYNVNDGTSTTNLIIPMGVLVGDTTDSGIVNSSDIAQTKGQLGQPVTAANFREDANADGAITAGDVVLVKANLHSALP